MKMYFHTLTDLTFMPLLMKIVLCVSGEYFMMLYIFN